MTLPVALLFILALWMLAGTVVGAGQDEDGFRGVVSPGVALAYMFFWPLALVQGKEKFLGKD